MYYVLCLHFSTLPLSLSPKDYNTFKHFLINAIPNLQILQQAADARLFFIIKSYGQIAHFTVKLSLCHCAAVVMADTESYKLPPGVCLNLMCVT